MTTIRTCYQRVRNQLEQAELPDAAYTARLILEACMGTSLPILLMQGETPVSPSQLQAIQTMTMQRLIGYPLQYLLGTWSFYGLDLLVGPGVLIPRADTETIVDFAVACRAGHTHTRLLDLCSGTGCIPLAIAATLPNVTATAVEYSDDALVYLKKNIHQYPYAVTAVQGDATDCTLTAQYSDCDIITCNPPYLTPQDMDALQKEVTFEPATALFGGTDGLDFYRRISTIWHTALKHGGWLIYEIGQNQETDVATILKQASFQNITIKKDLSGIVRLVAGQRGDTNAQ